MKRKGTTLKCKSGGVQNGNGAGHPRAVIDETIYRERINAVNAQTYIGHGGSPFPPHWDPKYSGWSNPSRPRNYAIVLRSVVAFST